MRRSVFERIWLTFDESLSQSLPPFPPEAERRVAALTIASLAHLLLWRLMATNVPHWWPGPFTTGRDVVLWRVLLSFLLRLGRPQIMNDSEIAPASGGAEV
ncbi:MAG TPA: hypothetical protein VNQ76_05310 [Planctomicrobium sp.]|nr:hypothetical protein [Planctomicrobium sp.]